MQIIRKYVFEIFHTILNFKSAVSLFQIKMFVSIIKQEKNWTYDGYSLVKNSIY